ncbi:MAG: hypothetical protein GXZ08_05435 [Tissierellia bacterium]|nr:hypothetical protein [Tissierellia bacterium]
MNKHYGYHVDRANTLKLDDTISLTDYETILSIVKQDAMAPALKMLYPDGLSNHGMQYALCGKMDFNSHLIEQIFELLRLKYFPNKVSRFQSIFAFSNYEDARVFCDSELKKADESCTTPDSKFSIYKIEWSHDNFQEHDMKLLSGTTVINSYQNALSYWEGTISQNSVIEILVKPPIKIVDLMK